MDDLFARETLNNRVRAQQCRRGRKVGLPAWQEALQWRLSTCLCARYAQRLLSRAYCAARKPHWLAERRDGHCHSDRSV